MIEYNRDNESGWVKTEEVKRKDYQEYIKASNRIYDKELIEVKDITFFTTWEEAENIQEKLKTEEQKEILKKDLEREERQGLKQQLGEIIEVFEGVEVDTLPLEEVKRHRAYIDIILSNLRGKIKDTKATKEVNKRERIEQYKASIKSYIEGGSFTSINKLCKDLKINRKTLYNLKLNEYIKGL